MLPRWRPIGSTTCCALLLACGGEGRSAVPPRPIHPAPVASGGAAPDPAGVHGEKPAQEPTPAPDVRPAVIVADPKVLAALEAAGFDLGAQLGGAPATRTADLARLPAYAEIVATVKADLAGDRRGDPGAGVGMRHAHRQLDERWLTSEATRFELIAVVNRLDRRVFAPAHCGEVRFVYRLGYSVTTASGPVASRAPFTVNVVHFVPQDPAGGCASAARAWLKRRDLPESDEAGWLTSSAGPLSPERRVSWTPKSVELNFQSVRWPSTVRPGLGGHAEYVLRVFHRSKEAPYVVPAPLENTVDAERLKRTPALLTDFVKWLGQADVLGAVDAGTAVVPERFLATRAVSVSPHGLARRGNRPFREALGPDRLAGLDLAAHATLRTPEALLRRLDTLSCPGCHQSRSIAGFHLLGVETDGGKVDRIEVPMSAHFHGELDRRREYVRRVAAGEAPDERRPPAERTPGDDGVGARCGLGDPGFASWTCRAGLTCVRVDDDHVGVCSTGAEPTVGEACEPTRIAAGPPRRDTARPGPASSCAGGRVCEATAVGFPGGACAGACDDLPDGAVCGGIPLLVEFNGCLARGVPFERCILENTRPGALAACGFHTPCRDDYVCAKLPAGGGACLPPYFLFQLRVDGHPM